MVLLAGFKAPATSGKPQQRALAKAGHSTDIERAARFDAELLGFVARL